MAEEGIPSELTVHSTNEGEIRPPKNVKVGLLFRKHAIDDKPELLVTEKKLKDFFTRTFSKGQRNIVLIERANATEKSEVYKIDSNEGFERYGSFRAGFANALMKQRIRDAGRDIPEGFYFDNAAIDEAITTIEESIFSNITPESSKLVYLWLQYKILDELNQEGYQITRVYEKGVQYQDTDEDFITNLDMTSDQYRAAVSNFARPQAVRDKQAASQIASLVEEAAELPENTNLAGLFGTTHHLIYNHLPEHIRSITDTSESEQLPDDPQYYLLSLLQGGTPASEIPPEVWNEAYSSYYTNNRQTADDEDRELDD